MVEGRTQGRTEWGVDITCLSRAHLSFSIPSITSRYIYIYIYLMIPGQRRVVSTNYLPGINVCALISPIFSPRVGPTSSTAIANSPPPFFILNFFFVTITEQPMMGPTTGKPVSAGDATGPRRSHRDRARWRTRASGAGALRWGRWPSTLSISTVVRPPRWLLR